MNFLTNDSVFTQARLPRRPLCTDRLSDGCWHEPAARALARRYIQINPPKTALWMVFDIDRPGGAFAWENENLPQPAWSCTTKHNGHGHIVFGLEIPVVGNNLGSKQVRYFETVKEAYRARLGADPGFAGILTKNPVHTDWVVERGLQKLWTLGELAEYIELPNKSQARQSLVGGRGRNVDTFDRLRFWAYQAVSGSRDSGLQAWMRTVQFKVIELNQYNTPLLDMRELDQIAKSVSTWVWRNYTGSSNQLNQAASDRGKLGGRPRTTTKIGLPWVLAGVDRSTWYRHKRATVRQP